jgi:uncharacterized protein (DUF1778 family)
MVMPTDTTRTARLEARITAEQKMLIERAAAYQGRSLSDFLVHTVQEAARAVIEEHEILRLNQAQSIALVETLLNPPAPNDALQEAAEAYCRDVAAP